MLVRLVLGAVHCLRWGTMLWAALLLFWVVAGAAAGPQVAEMADWVACQAALAAERLGTRGMTGLGALVTLWILARW